MGNSYLWEISQIIRAYVSVMKNTSNSEEIDEWVKWVNERMDWFDPMILKQDSFLKPFGRFHQDELEKRIVIDHFEICNLLSVCYIVITKFHIIMRNLVINVDFKIILSQ